MAGWFSYMRKFGEWLVCYLGQPSPHCPFEHTQRGPDGGLVVDEMMRVGYPSDPRATTGGECDESLCAVAEAPDLSARDSLRDFVPESTIFAAGDCCCLEWPKRESNHWFQVRLWSQARCKAKLREVYSHERSHLFLHFVLHLVTPLSPFACCRQGDGVVRRQMHGRCCGRAGFRRCFRSVRTCHSVLWPQRERNQHVRCCDERCRTAHVRRNEKLVATDGPGRINISTFPVGGISQDKVQDEMREWVCHLCVRTAYSMQLSQIPDVTYCTSYVICAGGAIRTIQRPGPWLVNSRLCE